MMAVIEHTDGKKRKVYAFFGPLACFWALIAGLFFV
jgi:hypothetical protein